MGTTDFWYLFIRSTFFRILNVEVLMCLGKLNHVYQKRNRSRTVSGAIRQHQNIPKPEQIIARREIMDLLFAFHDTSRFSHDFEQCRSWDTPETDPGTCLFVFAPMEHRSFSNLNRGLGNI